MNVFFSSMIRVPGGKWNASIPMKLGQWSNASWKKSFSSIESFRYIPSNFARREKRSLLDKIISKRLHKRTTSAAVPTNGYHPEQILSLALVKFRYDAESEDEISLNKGLWVNVLDKKNDGWWLVQHDQQRGWFPSNYLIEVKNRSTRFIMCFVCRVFFRKTTMASVRYRWLINWNLNIHRHRRPMVFPRRAVPIPIWSIMILLIQSQTIVTILIQHRWIMETMNTLSSSNHRNSLIPMVN